MAQMTQPEPQIVEKVVIVDKKDLEDAIRARVGETLFDPTPVNVFEAAQKLVGEEKTQYEDASKNIRDTIKRAYKNYLGI